jgi:hypothetical protein
MAVMVRFGCLAIDSQEGKDIRIAQFIAGASIAGASYSLG